MIKKLAALFAIAAAAAVGFVLCGVYFAYDVSAETPEDVNAVSTSSAVRAADRMELLCCGEVSCAEISMERSAFRTDFYPREPDSVGRFRNYDGPKADFVPVLMYHYFYDEYYQKPTKGNNSHSIQSVREQLQWLWQNEYVTLTMDELYEWLCGNIEIPAKCVVITSDDGQDNFFEMLQPELHKYGFMATSFVITSKRKNIPYKLTLPNVELHSHTHNMHKGSVEAGGIPDNRGMMQGVSVEEGVKDLKTSSDILGGSRYFAYPYGTYGGNSKEILRQAGFRLAFTTTPGLVRRGDDPLQLNRQRIFSSASVNEFRATIHYKEVKVKYE